MIHNGDESHRVLQAWTEILKIEKYKPYEIYKMCDMYGEACFNQKKFTNGLNMDLPLRTWIKKAVHGVEIDWLSGKKMFQAQRSVKNVMMAVFWKESSL